MSGSMRGGGGERDGVRGVMWVMVVVVVVE